MRTSRPLLLLLAVAAAFATGLYTLFAERFENGDIYPAYSTLRSDPLGCRALYSALEGPLAARRAFSPREYRDPDPASAWFFLGTAAARRGLATEQARAVDSLARKGARVVVALAPEEPLRARIRGAAGETDSVRADTASRHSPRQAADSASVVTRKIPDPPRREIPRFGIRLRRDTSRAGGEPGWSGKASAGAGKNPAGAGEEANAGVTPLPGRRMPLALGPGGDSLPFISALAFDSLDPAWKVLYRRDRRDSLPVAVERAWGKGSLVLVADSYWASNEALFRDTPGRLLSLLIGDRRRVVFDEAHLGIAEDDSLADLLARRGLHLMLPSLALLLLVWLWRARGAFEPAPPLPESPASGPADSPRLRGMRGLLRRYVPAEGLLAACHDLWRETGGRTSPRARDVEAEAARIVAECARDAAAQVEGYRRIQKLLKEGKPG